MGHWSECRRYELNYEDMNNERKQKSPSSKKEEKKTITKETRKDSARSKKKEPKPMAVTIGTFYAGGIEIPEQLNVGAPVGAPV